MKFELSQGLIVLPACFFYSGAQVTARCLIDTGSAGTALEIDLVNLDYSRPSRIVDISGVGGNQEVVRQQVEGVEFCGKVIKDFTIQFGDIASKFGFDGIIGSNLLDALGICIDYERREIRGAAK